jgi:flavin-dependent dehydrogenase
LTAVEIIGGGPAGAAAAIAARREGRAVRLFEKSTFPRHKVCGEFVSPEAAPILDELGVLRVFEQCRPARLSSVSLHFGSRERRWPLAEPAYGISRYAFDHLLLNRAIEAGAELLQESRHLPAAAGERVVVAHGRRISAPRGSRNFGFKTHFRGPVNDSIELFFFSGCYVGVSAVEHGITNVCGIAPEHLLAERAFGVDRLIEICPSLGARLGPLRRAMDWLITGPLAFGASFEANDTTYLAGDALGFIDPFTGSGIAAALRTGSFAGRCAARNASVRDYVQMARHSLGRQYRLSPVLRAVIRSGLAEKLARWIPGPLLFRLTRMK